MSKETALAMAGAPTTTVTPATPETAPGVQGSAPAPEAPKELESTRLAHLMKKESELVKQREAFKKEQEGFLSQRDQLKDVQEKLNQFTELKKTDPVKALKLMGFDDADLMNFLATAQDTSTPEEKAQKLVQSEIQKLKDEQAKKEADLTAKRNETVIKNFKSDIAKTVSQNKDEYEFINHYGSVGEELVYDIVEEVLKDSGELITIKEAADLAESYYEGEWKSMQGLKKIGTKLAPPPPAPVEEPVVETKQTEIKPVVSKPMPAKTLTSKTNASLASTTLIKRETIGEKKARLAQKLANLGKQ